MGGDITLSILENVAPLLAVDLRAVTWRSKILSTASESKFWCVYGCCQIVLIEHISWSKLEWRGNYDISNLLPLLSPFRRSSNLNTALDRIRNKFDKYQDVVNNTDTSDNPEFSVMRKTLTRDLKNAEKDIAILRKATEMVMKDRSKFPLITDAELDTRQKYVKESTETTARIKSGMESEMILRKVKNDEERAAAIDDGDHESTPVQKENARFIKGQLQETRYMLGEQDEALDSLGDAVDRLGRIGQEVGEELKEQNIMLDGLDDDLDSAGNRMGVVQAQLSKLLKTKDGCVIWTIVILCLILALLIALVIWT